MKVLHSGLACPSLAALLLLVGTRITLAESTKPLGAVTYSQQALIVTRTNAVSGTASMRQRLCVRLILDLRELTHFIWGGRTEP